MMFRKFICLVSSVSALLGGLVLGDGGYIAVERYSSKVFYASQSEKEMAIGKFSHLATAKIALDWAKASGTSMATMLVVPRGINQAINPLRLQPGDQLSLRDAIYSMSMANDGVSAMVLGDYIGRNLLRVRRKGGSSIAEFVNEMNQLALSLNMRRTKFVSPAGGAGKTTISDLARLACGVVKTHGYEFYVNQKSRPLTVLRVTGEKQRITVINTNKYLDKLGVSGLMVDGPSVVLSADRKPYVVKLANGGTKLTPMQLIVVCMGDNHPEVQAKVKQLITNSWVQYDAWREAGYPSSAKGKEFLK